MQNNLGTMKVKVKYDFGLGGNLLLASGAVAVGVYAFKKIVELNNAIEAAKGIKKATEAIDDIGELTKTFVDVLKSDEENTENAEQETEESI